MAIKSKNKILIIVWILLITIGAKGLIVGVTHANEYIAKDYFETPQFEGELNQFINYLSIFELNSMSASEAKKRITVSNDEIMEHRYRYGDLSEQVSNIKQQYEQKIQDAIAEGNQEVADIYIAERDKKIEDITLNFTSDEHVKQKIIKEKEAELDAYYRSLADYRSDYLRYNKTFNYYLVNTATGKTYTNEKDSIARSKTGLADNKNLVYFREYKALDIYYTPYYYEGSNTVNQILSDKIGTFEGYIAIDKAGLSGNNNILVNYEYFKQRQIAYYIYAISGIIAALISLYIYRKKLITVPAEMKKWQASYDRIPIDLRLLSFTITLFVALILLMETHFFLYYGEIFNYIKSTIFYLIFIAFFVAFTLIQGKFLYQYFKDWNQLKLDLKKSIIYRAYQMVTDAFIFRSIFMQIFIILGIVFVFGMGAIIVLIELHFDLFILYLFASIIVGIPLLIFIIKRAGYFNRIVYNTNELIAGNLGLDLPVKGKSHLATLAANINQLKYGVQISIKEQAKSERLKTELITNVSHDLRTPLTSIITYTELLKNPDLTKEERDDYIQIIDRKSLRLKALIEDLFEASKMASGNIELVKEKVDLVQLLQQALAEYNDKINESTLQFKVSKPDAPVYAIVDGQKLWRVFDNLIGNILKYSLENTRVYIAIERLNDKINISFKNVSKYELGGSVEELFERFKRGDTSRQTEGSGLGLAIAKSIVDLHEGRLDIDVDGDLFKATVSLSTRY